MQVKVMVVPVSPGVLGLEDRREGHGAYHHDDAAQVQVMDDGMEVTVGQRPATVLSLSQLPPQWWQPGPASESDRSCSLANFKLLPVTRSHVCLGLEALNHFSSYYYSLQHCARCHSS